VASFGVSGYADVFVGSCTSPVLATGPVVPRPRLTVTRVMMGAATSGEASVAQQLMAVERERSGLAALNARRDALIAALIDQCDAQVAMQITGMAKAGIYRAGERGRGETRHPGAAP